MAAPGGPGRWARLKGRAKNGLAAIGLFTVSGAVLSAAASQRRLKAGLPEEGFILELDLEHNMVVEHARPNPLAPLLDPQHRGTLELGQLAEALRAAGDDGRVKGLLALLSAAEGGLGFAQTQELRDAVADFRQRAGSRAATLAYADAFGEAGSAGTGAYYLASAFEFVAMQPTGLVSATGLAAVHPYARGLLDRWRIKPHFFQREEYKSAASFLTGRGSTRAERESLRATLASLSGQVVAGISQGRGLPAKQVQAAIDSAPHLSQDALKLGLIDARLYRDQAIKLLGRLYEARQPGPTPAAAAPAAGGKAGEAKAAGKSVLPQGLLPRLLAEPDAEPARPLKHVSLRRYTTALAEQRRRAEAAERGEKLRARVRQLADSALEATGWAEMLERLGGREPRPKERAGSADGSSGSGGGILEGGKQGDGSAAAAAEPGRRPRVALLTLSGPFVLGPGSSNPMPSPGGLRGSPSQIASLPVIQALKKARLDPAVKAVVLRVDSPGGSAAASDAIHREVALLRQAGKPVVVSMGNAAASGGYFISAPASKIVAQPGTITGSIGVLMGKLVFDEALREYGIRTETFKTARNADAMSAVSGFDKEQRRKVEAMMDDIYTRFKQVVAEGRGLSQGQVAKLAKGRVWTGEQALALGLVDQLGGLDAAIALAKQQAGLPEEEGAAPVQRFYPEHRSALAQLARAIGAEEEEGTGKGAGGGRGGGGGASPAAEAAAALAATALGQQLTAAESLVLAAQAQAGVVPPQCLSLEAERLAAAL
ncbi:hypothetical protein ABPG75_012832 [Micractinium tetrahymenae]